MGYIHISRFFYNFSASVSFRNRLTMSIFKFQGFSLDWQTDLQIDKTNCLTPLCMHTQGNNNVQCSHLKLKSSADRTQQKYVTVSNAAWCCIRSVTASSMSVFKEHWSIKYPQCCITLDAMLLTNATNAFCYSEKPAPGVGLIWITLTLCRKLGQT